MSATPSAARCSVLSAEAGEPLAGTAPRARAWLVLEQPGPYGFRALDESHLPERLRAALSALPKELPTTVVLARSMGRHADDRNAVSQRRFWLAHVAPGGVRMRSGVLDDAELLRPDLAGVLEGAANGELPPWGVRSDEPLLLVCTNARRDVCCALAGRPVADELGADPAYAGRVLESSHLGGHRFAPTGLLLPTGHVLGRFDAADARAVLDAAARGELASVDHHRGRTGLAQPAQAAETAVRRAAGVAGLDDLDALRVADGRAVPAGLRWQGEDDRAEVEVRHRDGRAWRVEVVRDELPDPKPESCGKRPVTAHVWRAGTPVPVGLWR